MAKVKRKPCKPGKVRRRIRGGRKMCLPPRKKRRGGFTERFRLEHMAWLRKNYPDQEID